MTDSPIPRWDDLTTLEAREALDRDPVVVLPLAAIEQHGPHLPLSTDLTIGQGILEEAFSTLPTDFPAWTLPFQAVGASSEHGDFPGTLSLKESTLGAAIRELGSSLARHGGRRLLIWNAHGGNTHVVDGAALDLRVSRRMLVAKASHFRFSRPPGVDLPEGEWKHGLHGGAVETSMMLHLAPNRVRMDQLEPTEPTDPRPLARELEETLRRLGPESEASFAWTAGDLHPSGVAGDPELASSQLGSRLVRHHGRVLGEILEDVRDFPLARLV